MDVGAAIEIAQALMSAPRDADQRERAAMYIAHAWHPMRLPWVDYGRADDIAAQLLGMPKAEARRRNATVSGLYEFGAVKWGVLRLGKKELHPFLVDDTPYTTEHKDTWES